MVIHGCAVPFGEWIRPATSDPAGWRPVLFEPGSLFEAVEYQRRGVTPPSRLSVDYAIDQGRDYHELASTADGSLRWELRPDGLWFQASMRNTQVTHHVARVGWLIQRKFITHCCVDLGHQPDTPAGAPVVVESSRYLGHLSLLCFYGPHTKSTIVRIGALPAVQPTESRDVVRA
jgi:hypothetical protein